MEVKLENLIEKIKQEGVEEAKKISQEIIRKSEEDSRSLIEDAQRQASQIIEEAKLKAEKLKANSHSALQQASRDMILVLNDKIRGLFDQVFKKEIAKTLTPDFLKGLITGIVEDWARGKKTEFVVSPKDVDNLKELVLSGLREELKNNLVIKTDDRVNKGFRVGLKGDNVYYDFTEEGIKEVLEEFLSPVLVKILKNDNG
ncbi:MAG: hypothetical protein JW734_04325 [Candidatus Omnitrophica bacterium]|nr:hypothetical protein [Candidatus Omnitrophota bacterium]